MCNAQDNLTCRLSWGIFCGGGLVLVSFFVCVLILVFVCLWFCSVYVGGGWRWLFILVIQGKYTYEITDIPSFFFPSG